MADLGQESGHFVSGDDIWGALVKGVVVLRLGWCRAMLRIVDCPKVQELEVVVVASRQTIEGLVRNPREHLGAEIKGWIDPSADRDKAKIVTGCIAMRNQNGGFFQAGFINGTWEPDVDNAPADVRSVWDGDEIQRLVSNHSSEAFEVHLHIVE